MKWWQQREAGRTVVGPGLPPVSVDQTAPPDVRTPALTAAGNGSNGHDA
jgi:hypothetical protein